jgi:membrane protein YqaA with SNARE-associated domain
MDFLELGFIGLFLISFLSATILPIASEGAVVLFLVAGYDPYLCLFIATAGNSLGGLTNYGLGMLGKTSSIKRFFRSEERYSRLVNSVDRYGYWLGLLSWTPFLGDPLTIALGFFRVKFIPFLVLMVLGKFIRYWVLIYLYLQT